MTSRFADLKYRSEIPKHILLRRLAWEVVWLLAFRPTPRWALHGWRRMLLRCFGSKIGTGSRIAPSCFVWAPWNLSIGEFTVLGEGVDCYSMDKISIGSKVAVSQRAFLCTGSHDVGSLRRPLTTAPIVIGDHCWIAAEVMVMPGVTVGEGTVVGARSLVTKSLPAWKICAGFPCRPLRARNVADGAPTEVASVDA